jgi:hypothetical protein
MNKIKISNKRDVTPGDWHKDDKNCSSAAWRKPVE